MSTFQGISYIPSLRSRGGLLRVLDPRTKLLAMALLSTLIFLTDDLLKISVFLILLLLVIALSKLSILRIISSLKAVLFLILITTILNSFMVEGKVIWSWKFLTLTEEGLRFSLLVAIRIIFISLFSLVVISNIDQGELATSLRRIFKPLRRVGVISDDFALGLTIAIRFIPVLLSELDRIYTAQLAKGIELERLSFRKKVDFWISIMVPMIKTTLKRAEDLALALEMRGYYEETRGDLTDISFSAWDLIAIYFLLAFTLWVQLG